MIKLRIINEFIKEEKEWIDSGKPENWNYGELPFLGLKEYDKNTWNDGKEYKFNSLKELQEFVDSLDLEWTDKFDINCNGRWSWYEIDKKLHIDTEEDNLMIIHISYHEEWRD